MATQALSWIEGVCARAGKPARGGARMHANPGTLWNWLAGASKSGVTGIWFSTVPGETRSRAWSGTPEIYFSKQIDNSRLVKVADRKRNREMLMFTAALTVFFALVMVYAWQHFSAVEYGYKIEALKSQRDNLSEMNRALRLEQASLRDPERIDLLAKRMGLVSPEAGQVLPLGPQNADPEAPVMARDWSSWILPGRN